MNASTPQPPAPAAMHALTWTKSSYSGGGRPNCVEVSWDAAAVIPIRDSKNSQAGMHLPTRRAFSALITAIKSGRFDG